MDPNSSIKTNDATAAAGWAPTYPNYEVLPPKVACLIPQCLEKFTTETELEDHKRKKGHWWCQECRVNLWDQKLLFEHNGRVGPSVFFFPFPPDAVISADLLHGSAAPQIRYLEI